MSKKKDDERPAEFPDVQGNNREVGYGKPPVHTRFQKGQSGNPKGRPRSAVLSDAMRARLAEAAPGAEGAAVESNADAVARALIGRARAGDVAAAKEVCDRAEGKARQAVPLSFKERQKLGVAVRAIMNDSQCTREEAIKTLGLFRPEALDLLDDY